MSHGPVPFRQFVLKVHSRCDLACNHCYVYEHADQSWRGRPKELDSSTAAQISQRVAEHAAAHRLPSVRIVLHGGEPLLLGPRRMRETLEALRAAISPVTDLDLRIHTNAVLLTESYLDLFAAYDVKVGVSLDGDRAANDRHRLYRDGRSSYDQVLASLERLRRPEYAHLYAGLLCTVDVANDPLAVYRGLLEQRPPRVDLLLPHATWEHQPFGLSAPRDPRQPRRGAGEYATWLSTIFDAWDADGRPMPIRTFESVLGALYGRPVTTEALGLDPVDLLVIETDGTLEQVDSLKTAYEGAAATGLDVWRHSLDEAAAVPGIAVRQQGIDGVSAVCRSCELVQVCGGGLYPHRYRPGHGFDNPSVYCADLTEMITHVMNAETRHGRGIADAATAPAAAVPAAVVGRAGSTADASATATADAYEGLDLREEDFAGLAAGHGSAAAVGVLRRNQAALQRDLLAVIAREGPQQDQRFGEAWNLLAALDTSAPEAVAATLAHPYTRAWAVKLVLDLRRGRAAGEDVHHLEAVAASAAVRAEHGRPVPVPVREGVAPLPGFGALAAGAAGRAGTASRASTGDRADERVWCATDADAELDLVRPLRHVDAAGLRLAIEDTDPYRDCHGFPADRLGAQEADAWARALSGAVAYVDEHLPAYAPGLRAGLTTVMPMAAPADGSARSAAARHAFGAVGLALPKDPALLALLLVHEFQHVKLGALLDIAELYDVTDNEPRHYAPWRPDPRPLEGLLQGTYAHIAVVDFWRVRRAQTSGAEQEAAETQFARWRMHTVDALEQLLKSGSLTALGERLAEAMGRTLDPWLAEPVDPRAVAQAHHVSQEHRAQYEQRLRAAR
jgi:uncharacterized protein